MLGFIPTRNTSSHDPWASNQRGRYPKGQGRRRLVGVTIEAGKKSGMGLVDVRVYPECRDQVTRLLYATFNSHS